MLAASVDALKGASQLSKLFDTNVATLAVAARVRMIEALGMLWPSLLVAVCLVGIHAYFGIEVLTSRTSIFVDLALAQIAALGATVAFMLLAHPPDAILAASPYSLGFTLACRRTACVHARLSTRVPRRRR